MDSDNNHPIAFDFLRDLLLSAGKIALEQRGQMQAVAKADHTPVTVVDQQVEAYLIERIQARHPTHQILSEEIGLCPGTSDLMWVIDPIDGTRSFASGLPVWGVSIGVLRGDEALAGGLYLPVTGELYCAIGGRAYYNDRLLAPLAQVDLDSILVFLAVPSDAHRRYTIRYPRARSMGSSAAHMAYTGMGAAVGALSSQYGLWDLAGMLPFIAAQGVTIETLYGQPFRPSAMFDAALPRETLLSAHPAVIDRLRELISLRHDSA